jgi:hypothetical protein
VRSRRPLCNKTRTGRATQLLFPPEIDSSSRFCSRHGHHPYMETDCRLLRQRTKRARVKACHAPARVWSPEVRVESKSQKPPRGVHRSPCRLFLSLYVLRQTVCKRLIFLKWHGRGRKFESHQVHQTLQTLPLARQNVATGVQLGSKPLSGHGQPWALCRFRNLPTIKSSDSRRWRVWAPWAPFFARAVVFLRRQHFVSV